MGLDLETLLILAVLAFILFGPEKLPEYAATLGKFVAKMRQATTEITRQYQDQNPFTFPQEPPLPPAPESTCPYCQQTVPLNFTFCPKCGHRVQEDHYPPPPQPPEPMLQPETPSVVEPVGQPEPTPALAPALQPEPTPALGPAQEAYPRIRLLQDDEIDRALEIINQAALAYKGVIPEDCWQEPYMPEAELRAEIAAGVNFWGCETKEGLVGVMGRQDLKDVTLIRHAYVDPASQRQGIGRRLLTHLLQEITGPVLVGTWAAAWWAIRFYERHNFQLVTQTEKYRLLNTYWSISPRQAETSVVLGNSKWFASEGRFA
jgi:Sec-independent protein translocase protein TatA/GNAT superfamily N-acetyltransferase